MKRFVSIGIIIGLGVLLSPPVRAGTWMPMNVVGNGGAKVSGGTYTMFCTVGQPAVGTVGPGPTSYVCENGFWHGLYGYVSDAPEPIVDVVPTRFELGACRPNPIASASTMRYAVPRPAYVSIRLYDITGRVVLTLVDGHVDPGYHDVPLPSGRLASGIYFCCMRSEGFSATRRLLFMK